MALLLRENLGAGSKSGRVSFLTRMVVVIMVLLCRHEALCNPSAVKKRSTSTTACGGTLTGVGGVIEFPYGLTSTQSSQVHCTWIIKAPKDHYILFHAEHFNIPKERFSENCQDASLRFYNKNQRYANVVPSACGNNMTPKFLPTNVVAIEYVEKTTDFQLQRNTQFTIVWTAYSPQSKCAAQDTSQTVALSRKQKQKQKQRRSPSSPTSTNVVSLNPSGGKRAVSERSEEDIENGLFRCELSKLCVSRELLCDGHANCGFDVYGNMDDSDEKCVGVVGDEGTFWSRNWNVVLSVAAVLTVTCLAIVSYYIRHQAILRSRRKRRIEAIQKRERHFDDPLPPVPNSEMGTQSSLNLAKPPADYSLLPATPYDMINANGQKFPTHFGMPDVMIDATSAVQISAQSRNFSNPNPAHPLAPHSVSGPGMATSMSHSHSSHTGRGGGASNWNFRRSQSGASSKASSSPQSSRSAPASRHPIPNGYQQQPGSSNARNSHRGPMSDSNDSDSAVFSGSERGGASNLNGCRRKHHRDCPNKSKQQQQRGPSRNTNSNSGTLREWEIQYDPNTQQAMTTNTQSNAPCMCQVPSQIPGQQNFNPGQCQNVMQNPNYVELVNPFVEQNSGGSNSSRRSRSQDFLDINEAHGIPHQVRLQSAQNLRTGNNYRSRNGRSGHANFAYRSSQGYHSENDSYRAPLASTRGRPVMGGSRGYKSETDDGGSSVVSAGRGSSNGGGSSQRVTTAQRAFALLRKQQQEQLRLQQREQQQQKLQTHQYEQIRI